MIGEAGQPELGVVGRRRARLLDEVEAVGAHHDEVAPAGAALALEPERRRRRRPTQGLGRTAALGLAARPLALFGRRRLRGLAHVAGREGERQLEQHVARMTSLHQGIHTLLCVRDLITLLYFHSGMELKKLLGGVKDLLLPGILLGMLDHREE